VLDEEAVNGRQELPPHWEKFSQCGFKLVTPFRRDGKKVVTAPVTRRGGSAYR